MIVLCVEEILVIVKVGATGVGVGAGDGATGVGVGAGDGATGVGVGAGDGATGVGVGAGDGATGVGVGAGAGVGVGVISDERNIPILLGLRNKGLTVLPF